MISSTILGSAVIVTVFRAFVFLEAYDWKIFPSPAQVQQFKQSVSATVFAGGAIAIATSTALPAAAIFTAVNSWFGLTNIILIAFIIVELFLVYVAGRIYSSLHNN